MNVRFWGHPIIDRNMEGGGAAPNAALTPSSQNNIRPKMKIMQNDTEILKQSFFPKHLRSH